MTSKSLVLIGLLVLIGFKSNSQEEWPTHSAELELSAYKMPFNKESLSIDPFGEFGSQYLFAQEGGLNYSFTFKQRFSPSIGIGQFQYFTESYSINPFPSGTNGEFLSSESRERISGFLVHPELRYSFFNRQKIRLLLTAGYQLAIPTKVSVSSTSSYQGQVEVKETNENELERELYRFITAGIRTELRFSEHVFGSAELQLSQGEIPIRRLSSFEPGTVSKLDISLPVSVIYKW